MMRLTAQRSWLLLLPILAVTSCSMMESSVEVKTTREAAAANCEQTGKCVKDPGGLVVYNPDLVTENFVLKLANQNPTLLTRLMNLIDAPRLLLASEKLEPLIRGVAIIGEFDPCDSPKAIAGANPTTGQLRSLKQGRYKACVSYVGEGLNRRVHSLAPIDVDTTSPEVSPIGVTHTTVTPTTASLSWSKAGDNLTLDGNLVYSVYTSKSQTLDSLDAVFTYGNKVPGRLTGGTAYMIESLTERTPYHVAVIVSDEAGNHSLVGRTYFTTAALDSIPPSSPSVAINSAATHTNSTSATLTLSAVDASEMYVSNVAGCSSGGIWEIFAASRSWTLAQTNATATVFVKFRDLVGNETVCLSDTITHDNIAPTVPSVSGATPTADTTPTWTWSGDTTGGTGTYRYKLNDSSLSTGATETTNTSFTPSSPLSEVTHTLYVQERDTAGNWSSPGSHEILVVTPPSAPILSTPTILVNSLSLSWTPSDAATSYNIYWSNSAGVGTTSTKITNVSSGYTHSSLSAGSNYFYRVSAIKSGVESALSNEVSGTPLAPSLNDPIISVTNYQSLTVSIAPATSGETIFYTLDNSNPTQASTTYTGPFSIQPTQTVKAIAIKSGYAPSAVVSYNPNFDATEDFAGALVKYRNRFSGQDNLSAWRAPNSTPVMPSISTSPPAGPPSSAALYAASGAGLYSLTRFGKAGSILPSLTQDFTIEMWVYFSSINASTMGSQGSATQWALDGVSIAAAILRADDGDPFNIVVLVDGGVGLHIVQNYNYAANPPVRSTPGLIKTGQWHHFAASVKSGQYSRIFVDGKPVISTSVTPVSNNNAPYEWLDGHDFNLSSALYISNMRLTQFARYESEFSPQFVDFSASPASDTTAPVISAASVTTLSPGTTRTPGVTFTSNESGTYQLFSVAGCGSGSVSASAAMLAASNSATTNPLTSNATTTIYVRATDVMGNSSCTLIGSYTHDNTAPLTPVIADATKSFNAPFNTTIQQGVPSDANFTEFRYSTDESTPSCSTGTASTAQPTTVSISAATITLKVVSCDSAGNISASIASATYTYDPTPPNAPAVTGTTPISDAVMAQWSWSGDTTGGNGTYRYKFNNSDLSSGATQTTSTTLMTGGPLSAGTHTLYVQERDAAGNWSLSGSFAVEVVTPPAAPTLSSPTRYISSLGLSWASVAGATSYNLYWSTTAGVSTASTRIQNVTSVYTHTPLTGGTTYYYRLAGVKNGVEGALSNEESAVPYSSPAPTVTSVSPGTGSLIGGTSVTITGTGFVSGATVTIGGASATDVSYGSSSSLTLTTPAGTIGAKDIVVTNPDGQTGTLSSGFTYTAEACAGDCYLEGISPNFAQDLAIGTERIGPSDITLTLQYANGSSGFKIWKEKNGNRILNASGITAHGWQQQLNRAGTGFIATEFTTGSNIAGRVCPTNVFLSHSDMTAEGRCVYYDPGNAAQRLDKNHPSREGPVNAIEAEDWLQLWSNLNTGRGASASYYEGNIKTCADKGMRLPTMYETTMTKPGGSLPAGDPGVSPTWAGSINGVPGLGALTWTASPLTPTSNNGSYYRWDGANAAIGTYYSSSTGTNPIRCVLPNSIPTCAGDCYLEGSAPNYAQDFTIGTERIGPSGSTLTLQYATGSSGFKIWKEKGGTRILNASGLVSNGWQNQLTRAGTAFSATDFTNSSNIAGRVCPTNVFLSHSNMTATNRCLYYDGGNAAQSLEVAAGIEGSDWLQRWNGAGTGRGSEPSYYEGNIKTCADKGMRLPVMYETSMAMPTSDLPTGDAISPAWSGSAFGVPSRGSWRWTASANTFHNGRYWGWWGESSSPGYYTHANALMCVLPNDIAIPAASCTGDCYREGSAPNFAQDLAIGTERQGPSGSTITLEFANGTSGFKIWKEKGGTKILNANGLVTDGWQKQLTRAGTGFSAIDFTNGANIAGRACPTHVFLSHSNMTATGRCLYYDNVNASQTLNAATGTEAQDWLMGWNRAATGAGISPSWFEGNIKTCADKGMRLPTLYETTIPTPTTGMPTDAAPTFGGTRVPYSTGSSYDYAWTASAHTTSSINYWQWNDASESWDNYDDTDYGPYQLRCVLP